MNIEQATPSSLIKYSRINYSKTRRRVRVKEDVYLLYPSPVDSTIFFGSLVRRNRHEKQWASVQMPCGFNERAHEKRNTFVSDSKFHSIQMPIQLQNSVREMEAKYCFVFSSCRKTHIIYMLDTDLLAEWKKRQRQKWNENIPMYVHRIHIVRNAIANVRTALLIAWKTADAFRIRNAADYNHNSDQLYSRNYFTANHYALLYIIIIVFHFAWMPLCPACWQRLHIFAHTCAQTADTLEEWPCLHDESQQLHSSDNHLFLLHSRARFVNHFLKHPKMW